MSQNLPPTPEGQESSPNPIELFWEKNRRLILAGVGIFVAIVAVYYVLAYMERQKVDREMSLATAGPNMDRAYADPDVSEWNASALGTVGTGLISNLNDDLAQASDGELEKALADLTGSPRLETALWGASRAYYEKAVHAEAGAERDAYFSKASETIQRLQSEFPKSQWVIETDYPVQKRERVPYDDDNPPEQGAEPEYVDPIAGSPAGRLLAQIDRQKAFFAENSSFFTPTYPAEGSPEVVLEFEGYGPVTIALYESAMGDHVHAFLDLVHSGFYDGQRVYEVTRKTEMMRQFGFGGSTVEEVKFGIPSSREADRTKWIPEFLTDDDLLEFESTEAVKALSHFPGVLTAADQGGKGAKARYSLIASDGAGSMDGKRAMIGIAKDPDSLQLIQDMAQASFSTEGEQDSGTGKPSTNITITSAKVTVKGGWEPKPEAPKKPEDAPETPPGDGEGGK